MKKRSLDYFESKIGLKIGRLTLVRYSHRDDLHHNVIIRCDCGVEKSIRWQNFISAYQQSCGCMRKEIKNPFRHHPLYRVWTSLKERCLNPKHANYKYYGGKGVKICDGWFNYKKFYDWCLGNGWGKGLQLDKDIKGDGTLYSPETCCFVTPKINTQNSSQTKLTKEIAIEIRNSKEKNVVLAKRYGVTPPTISSIKRNKTWV